MTEITDFYYKPCDKLDANCVDAYMELVQGAQDYELMLGSSWGESTIDMRPITKASETVTTLELVPADNPISLQYTKEDGTVDCITGDDLSRIISLQYLKDVSGTPAVGQAPVWAGNRFIFQDVSGGGGGGIDARVTQLESQVAVLNADLSSAQQTITTQEQDLQTAQAEITALSQRVTNLENGGIAPLPTCLSDDHDTLEFKNYVGYIASARCIIGGSINLSKGSDFDLYPYGNKLALTFAHSVFDNHNGATMSIEVTYSLNGVVDDTMTETVSITICDTGDYNEPN